MATGVGSLRVLLGLDAAEFTTGLARAEAQAKKFGESQRRNQAAIDRQVIGFQRQAEALGRSTREQKLFELAQKGATATQLKSADASLRQVEAHDKLIKQSRYLGAALGLAATIGATGFAVLVKGAIDAADNLNDLSKSTGIAVETLGGIGFAAKQAGTDLDGAALAINKLNLKIAAARSGDKEASQAFALVGIDQMIKDGASADAVLSALADKFASYQDGAEKNALANELFGKSYASLIPLLNDGGKALQENIDYFKKYSGVTTQVAAEADAFNDTMEKVKLLFSALFTTVASQLLPAMQSLADGFESAKNEAGRFDSFAAGLKTTLETLIVTARNIGFVFSTLGDSIGATVAIYGRVLQGDIAGARAIGEAYRAVSEARRSALDASDQKTRGIGVSRPGDQSDAESRRLGLTKYTPPKGRAPGIPEPRKGSKDDTAARLKRELDGQLQLIRDKGEERRSVIAFQERLLEAEYQNGIVNLSVFHGDQQRLRDKALAAHVAQIDQEIAAQKRYAQSLTKGSEQQDANNRIKNSERDRATIIRQAGEEEQLSILARQREVKNLTDRYDDLRASILELKGDTAGAIKIKIDQQVEAAQQTVNAVGGDLGQVSKYRAALEGTAALAKAQTDYNALLERARNAEEDIMITAKMSGTTDMDVLRQVGAARAQSLAQMGEMVERARELAQTLSTDEAIQFADALALAFKRANLEVDPLRDKMLALGEEMAHAFDFTDAITGARSLRDVIGQIQRDLVNMITREAATNPIKNSITGYLKGSLGGGGFLESLLGGASGGGFGSGMAWSFPKAGGGYAAAGSIQRVNERGPELLDVSGKQYLMMGNRGGTVTPSQGGGGARTLYITVNQPAGMNRQSANQFGAVIARQIRLADERDN